MTTQELQQLAWLRGRLRGLARCAKCPQDGEYGEECPRTDDALVVCIGAKLDDLTALVARYETMWEDFGQ